MKCEICHKAEAETAITVKKDGVAQELYVCRACATAHKEGRDKGSGKSKPRVTVVNGSATPPPPFVEELVKATLGFMKGVAEAEENEQRTCPGCHASWEQIKSSGRIGCPSCWKTFARQIREEFLAAEFGPAHVGTAPAIDHLPDQTAVKAILERDLKAAIAREDYRQAALLKGKLDELFGGKESAS